MGYALPRGHGRISGMAQTAQYAPGGTTGPGKVRLSFTRTGLIGALLLAVLALTGCVTVQLDATVHPDGTLSGTARYGVAKSLAAFAGGQDQLLAQLRSEGSCDFGGNQGSTKNFDDGTYIGIDCSFNHVTMAEFNSGEAGPKLSKDGDQFHLTGNMNLLQALSDSGTGLFGSGSQTGGAPAPSGIPTDLFPSGFPTDLSSLLPSGIPTDLLPSGFPTDLSSLLPSGIPTDLLPSGFPTDLSSLLPTAAPNSGIPGLDPSTLLKTAKISFAFTFPGKVHSSQGKVDGRKVTFKPDSSGTIDFQTTADATPSNTGGLGRTTWLLLALLILVLLAGAGLLLRRRRAAGRVAVAAGYPPAGYSQPGYPAAGYSQPGYPAAGYPPADYSQPGYPEPHGYSPPGYSQPHGDQYPTRQYPAGQYSPQQYPPQQYPAQPQDPTQQYPPQQYPAQPHYPTEQYPAQSPYAPPHQPPPPPAQPDSWAAPPTDPSPWSRPAAEPTAEPQWPHPEEEREKGSSDS
jgi:hypothetical protein